MGPLIREVCDQYSRVFPGRPRVFRAPARINLRGMHIDTHGGALNLITHQRETVLAAGALEQPVIELQNVDSHHGPVTFAFEDAQKSALGWEGYVRGAVRALADRTDAMRRGLCGVVSSAIPEGAGLSSSSALCLTVIDALAAVNDIALDPIARIELVRAAEWHAGARTGTSDPGAMVLAGRGIMASGPLPPGRIDLGAIRSVAWPSTLGVVVADSLERRALAGAQAVSYARNRFAYSAALGALRVRFGADSTLNDVSSAIDSHEISLREVLNVVPLSISVESLSGELRQEYDAMFRAYADEIRPREFELHGPLVFGVAESARARAFPLTIEARHYSLAGEIMKVGHSGDWQSKWSLVDSEVACVSVASGRPLWHVTGAYGASTPALDMLVEAALADDAFGASLTGAGMGGCVVALCRTGRVDHVVKRLRQTLQSQAFAENVGREELVSLNDAEEAVVVNETVPPAGEVVFVC